MSSQSRPSNSEILPFSELTKKSDGFDALAPGKSIEGLQKDLVKARLAEGVPEEVRHIFKVARKLCIYGYFQYDFFTVAHLMSFLALECALKHRFMQFYKNRVPLVKGDKREVLETDRFERVFEALTSRRWKLEGHEDFHPSFKGLAEWAGEVDLISKRSQWLIEEAAVKLRNSLAHPFGIKISMPGQAIMVLERTAELINELFG